MLEQVKKFRKGKTDKIDFLDDLEATQDGASGQKKSQKNGSQQGGFKKGGGAVANKRNFKDQKFGFGGKKKGGKANTKQSADDVSGYRPFRSKNQNGGGRPGKRPGSKMAKNKRFGKERRQKMKGKN